MGKNAFISYSWDDDSHREWVLSLAERLREDGVDVTPLNRNATSTATSLFRGSPGNLSNRSPSGPYFIGVEAKADEPFGETVEATLAAALERKLSNPRSNGIARIEQLAAGLLGPRAKGDPAISKLRYQLLTACAGALCEAKRHDCDRTIMLVQEFMSDKTDDLKHQRNADDLNSMIERLSHSKYSENEKTSVWGPFAVPGDPLVSIAPKLYIGKVTRNLRSGV